MAKTLEERYWAALQRLRVRVDDLEEMARWKLSLTHRLWRANVILRATGETSEDLAALEEEVKLFARVADALTNKRL